MSCCAGRGKQPSPQSLQRLSLVLLLSRVRYFGSVWSVCRQQMLDRRHRSCEHAWRGLTRLSANLGRESRICRQGTGHATVAGHSQVFIIYRQCKASTLMAFIAQCLQPCHHFVLTSRLCWEEQYLRSK